MAYLDGERFIFGDSNLVRPGRPVDTLLEGIMRNNEHYLLKYRGNRVGHSRRRNAPARPNTGYLGDKTYASLNRVNFFSRLMWVCPNLKRIDIFSRARVGTEAPGDPSTQVKVWIELEGFGPPQMAIWEKDTRYKEYKVSFTFDENIAPPPRPVLVQMKLWMKSEKVGAADTPVLGTLIPRYPGEMQVSGLYPAPSFPGPNATTLHEKYTSVAGAEGVDNLVQLGEDSVIVYPPEIQGGGSYQTGYLSYLQIKGIFYEEEYTPALAPRTDFRAGMPVTGQHMLAHVLAIREVHTRPRLLDFGHQGERVDDPEVWHYHEEWQYVRSEGSYPWRDLLRAPVILDEPHPSIEVGMLILPYQLLESYTQGVSGAQLRADGAVAEWEVKAELIKYTVGGEVVLVSETKSVVLTHLPTDGSGRWPSLTQLKWREFGPNGPRHPTLKEGLLYEVDQALVERVYLVFDGSSIDVSMIQEPLSLRLSMRQAGDAQWITTEPGLGQDPQHLGLLMTGVTVWARHT